MRVEPGAQRVHETDYGEPDFGGVFKGIFLLLFGFVLAIIESNERRRRT